MVWCAPQGSNHTLLGPIDTRAVFCVLSIPLILSELSAHSTGIVYLIRSDLSSGCWSINTDNTVAVITTVTTAADSSYLVAVYM